MDQEIARKHVNSARRAVRIRRAGPMVPDDGIYLWWGFLYDCQHDPGTVRWSQGRDCTDFFLTGLPPTQVKKPPPPPLGFEEPPRFRGGCTSTTRAGMGRPPGGIGGPGGTGMPTG